MELTAYIKSINSLFRTGETTEHSYRGALADYVQQILGSDYIVVNEPARIRCGAPDYMVLHKGQPVFYIEAKDIGDNDLDGKRKNVHKEQFDRYKHALDRIVFTDYVDFHFYEFGEWQENIRIGDIHDCHIDACMGKGELFESRIRTWGQAKAQRITSARRLADVMAAKARLLRHVTEAAMLSEEDDGNLYADDSLRQLFSSFRSVLINDLSIDKFADMYAQTIVYGLFAARLNDPTPQDFSRAEAVNLIPKSNPFLRRLFNSVAGIDLDQRIAWIVDDLVDTFAATDVGKVMSQYGQNDQRNDPMVHFYEDFLTAYDPQLRKDMGVWYTPKPVVQFIVRAVDELLQSHFGLKSGLSDTSRTQIGVAVEQSADKRAKDGMKHTRKEVHRVQILDVATGTGTFLAEVITQIHSRVGRHNAGLWQDYVERELKPRLNGFELMMAPYTIAHLKLDSVLRETGYRQIGDRRLNVFLTDSLAAPADVPRTLFNAIAMEAAEADKVKRDIPVMCVIGNPPYSGESHNKSKWIMQLMEDYKKEPGGKVKLKERNPKWLNDDYVKFIRMAQHFVMKNGQGIVGYINPHGFLDNPTFRGMRWQLLKTFDTIYVVNLHGNSKKGETCPDGSKDENVFNIMQGVSINIFVKTAKKKANALGKVYYADLYGLRKDKLQTLSEHTLAQMPFQEVETEAPMYFFVPKNNVGLDEYNRGFGIPELFVENSVGVVTTKDAFLVCNSRKEVYRRINDLVNMPEDELRNKYKLKDTRDWTLKNAKEDVGNRVDDSKIISYDYRPFDKRYIYYTGKTNGIVARPRFQVLQHLESTKNGGRKAALLTCRQCIEAQWTLVGIADSIVDDCRLSNKTKERGYIFPLYVYKDHFGREEQAPNFNPDVYNKVAKALGIAPKAEDLFYYIYAVLHSHRYRERYKEFLKTDFPRIPYPKDTTLFFALAEKGKALADLHLMHNTPSWELTAGFPICGTNIVEQPEYKDGCVWINSEQHFTNIAEAVYSHPIGGYHPMQKWLKDRKGKPLTYQDIIHYEQMAYAITHMIALMEDIDKL